MTTQLSRCRTKYVRLTSGFRVAGPRVDRARGRDDRDQRPPGGRDHGLVRRHPPQRLDLHGHQRRRLPVYFTLSHANHISYYLMRIISCESYFTLSHANQSNYLAIFNTV